MVSTIAPISNSTTPPASGEVWVALMPSSQACAQSMVGMWQSRGYRVALASADEAATQADITLAARQGESSSRLRARLIEAALDRADVIVLADEAVEPDTAHTGPQIAALFRRHFSGTRGVMLPAPTAQVTPDPASTLGVWIGRAWAQACGASALAQAFESNWQDAWLCVQAERQGRLWQCQEIIQSIIRHGTPAQHNSNLLADTLQFLALNARAATSSHATDSHAGSAFAAHATQHAEQLWWALAGKHALQQTAHAALENAFAHCAAQGWSRIALFGAGRHTRAGGAALMSPHVEIIAIVDDDTRLTEHSLWGYPIRRSCDLSSLKADAIVISSDTHAQAMTGAIRRVHPVIPIVDPYALMRLTQESFSPAQPLDPRTQNMTTTSAPIPPRPASTAPGVMSVAKEFSSELARLIRDEGLTRVLETGTYDGRGSTRNFAQALSSTGKPWQLHTVEINPRYAAQAKANNKDFADIHFHEGLSLPRASMPQREETRRWIDECAADFPGLYVDYLPNDPVEGYHKETFNDSARDGILPGLLASREFDLVLLDSAGHLGYLEFDLFCRQCRFPCILALDDVDHIKHARSVAEAMKDPRFTLLFRTHEKFGAAIFRFDPFKVARAAA